MNNKNTAAEIMPILNKYGLKIIYRPDPIIHYQGAYEMKNKSGTGYKELRWAKKSKARIKKKKRHAGWMKLRARNAAAKEKSRLEYSLV